GGRRAGDSLSDSLGCTPIDHVHSKSVAPRSRLSRVSMLRNRVASSRIRSYPWMVPASRIAPEPTQRAEPGARDALAAQPRSKAYEAFLQRAAARDVLALVRLLADPQD